MDETNIFERHEKESLEDLYLKALAIAQRLESGEVLPRTHEYAVLHSECLNLFAVCAAKIESLELFSRKQAASDVKTRSLRFINVNYYIAYIVEKTPINPSTLAARVAALKIAAKKYCEFAAILDEHGLRPADCFRDVLSDRLPSGARGSYCINFKQRYDRNDRASACKIIARNNKELLAQWNKITRGCDDKDVRTLELCRLQLHLSKAWHAVKIISDELYLINNMADGESEIVLSDCICNPSLYLNREVLESLLESPSEGPVPTETQTTVKQPTYNSESMQSEFTVPVEKEEPGRNHGTAPESDIQESDTI